MCKINVKKLILEIAEKNNLEILKIDLCDEGALIAKDGRLDPKVWGKLYTTLESLDFEVESIFMHDEVCGMVYCQDKDTKEPVWVVSCGDEGGSWWEVNRVPYFYKDKENKQTSKEKAIEFIKRAQGQLSKGFVSYRFVKMALNNINKALKELED